jgi:hypothetical protein
MIIEDVDYDEYPRLYALARAWYMALQWESPAGTWATTADMIKAVLEMTGAEQDQLLLDHPAALLPPDDDETSFSRESEAEQLDRYRLRQTAALIRVYGAASEAEAAVNFGQEPIPREGETQYQANSRIILEVRMTRDMDWLPNEGTPLGTWARDMADNRTEDARSRIDQIKQAVGQKKQPNRRAEKREVWTYDDEEAQIRYMDRATAERFRVDAVCRMTDLPDRAYIGRRSYAFYHNPLTDEYFVEIESGGDAHVRSSSLDEINALREEGGAQ